MPPWLSQYKVSDLELPSQLVSLHHPGNNLFQAIDLLAEQRLLSVPVLAAGSSALLGMVDALDIVAFTVQSAAQKRKKLEDVHLDHVMGLAHGGAGPATVGLETPLDEVASIISGPARRAMVLTADGEAYSIITQSAMVQFMKSKLQDKGALNEQWTAQYLCTPDPVCVTEVQSALSAFQVINDNGVSSVAIVDEELGQLISVASATDLVVGLARMPDKAKALEKLASSSITEVVTGNRQLEQKARAATVVVSPETSVVQCLDKLSKTRVHRVIVCVDQKPQGVLSLTDLCRALSQA
mmetsp:Transcript_6012/g.14340  ORF Transcript_6012/g.14340 Transcript_6012/m.14340 type:complete len:297 (-) Transcript_6012:96-986(-)